MEERLLLSSCVTPAAVAVVQTAAQTLIGNVGQANTAYNNARTAALQQYGESVAVLDGTFDSGESDAQSAQGWANSLAGSTPAVQQATNDYNAAVNAAGTKLSNGLSVADSDYANAQTAATSQFNSSLALADNSYNVPRNAAQSAFSDVIASATPDDSDAVAAANASFNADFRGAKFTLILAALAGRI